MSAARVLAWSLVAIGVALSASTTHAQTSARCGEWLDPACDVARAPTSTTTIDTHAWPDTHVAATLHRPLYTREPDPDRAVAAVTTILIGWLVGIAGAVIDELARTCGVGPTSTPRGLWPRVGCNTWALGFIPLVGGIVAGATELVDAPPGTSTGRLDFDYAAALGGVGTSLQALGLVALGLALGIRLDEVRYLEIGIDDVSLALVPSAPAADVGVSFVVRL